MIKVTHLGDTFSLTAAHVLVLQVKLKQFLLFWNLKVAGSGPLVCI